MIKYGIKFFELKEQVMQQESGIIIINGYHKRECFAMRVGDHLAKSALPLKIRVKQYTGKPDKKSVINNLRRFMRVEDNLCIVLHSDAKFIDNAGIILRARSKKDRKKIRKILLNFALTQEKVIALGTFLTPNARQNLIDVELGPRMNFQEGADFITSLSIYLANDAS